MFARYVMYAYSGIEDIKTITNEKNTKITIDSKPNLKLLAFIFIAMGKVYNKIIFVSATILSLLTIYILFIIEKSDSTDNKTIFIASWIIFCISVVLNLSSMKDSSKMKGLNKIYDLQNITIVNSFLVMFSKILLLVLGYGIMGLAISNLLTVILLKVQYKLKLKDIYESNLSDLNYAKNNFFNEFSEEFASIKNKSKGMGGVLISQFLQTQFLIIILPLFLTLNSISEFTLSYQLASTIVSISSILFSVYYIKLGNSILKQDVEGSRKIYIKTFASFVLMFMLASLMILFMGKEILSLIKSNIELLPTKELLLLLIYMFVFQIVQRSTSIISLTNDQRFVKSLIYSSILSCIGVIIVLYFSNSLIHTLIWLISVQLAYNFWKWLIRSYIICMKNETI